MSDNDLKITKEGIRQAVYRAARADSTWVQLVDRVATQIANYHIADYRSNTIKKLQEQKASLEKDLATVHRQKSEIGQDLRAAREHKDTLREKLDGAVRENNDLKKRVDTEARALARQVLDAAIAAVRAEPLHPGTAFAAKHEAPATTLSRQDVAAAFLDALNTAPALYRPLREAWDKIEPRVIDDLTTIGGTFIRHLHEALVKRGGAEAAPEPSKHEMQEAQEYYYAAGGMPSDPSVPTDDTEWYWRCAAKLWRDRATAKVTVFDDEPDASDVLEMLEDAAVAECTDGKIFLRAWRSLSRPTQQFIAVRVARGLKSKLLARRRS